MFSFKVLQQTGFLLLLMATLWLAFLYARVLPTSALIWLWLLSSAAMARGLWIRSRVRRRAWLAVYLRERGVLFRVLRGGVLMRLTCIIVGSLLSLFLLVTLLRVSEVFVWQALLVTACVLLPAQQIAYSRLQAHIHDHYLAEIAWRFAASLCGLTLLLVLAWHGYHQQYPNLLQASLDQAVWHYVDQENARSAYLLTLLQLIAALDGLSQWLAQQLLPAPVGSFMQAGAWVLLLVRESLFVWSFLIMCRGVLIFDDETADLGPMQ
jgi:hypothetical protein